MMKVAFLCVAALATATAFSPAAFAPTKGALSSFKPALRSGQAKADFEISDGVKYELNPFVLAAAFYGWVIPTLLPSNIPLYGSKGIGLSQAFYNEIAEHLAKFPGLFATMLFGTIGYNGYYLANKK